MSDNKEKNQLDTKVKLRIQSRAEKRKVLIVFVF